MNQDRDIFPQWKYGLASKTQASFTMLDIVQWAASEALYIVLKVIE